MWMNGSWEQFGSLWRNKRREAVWARGSRGARGRALPMDGPVAGCVVTSNCKERGEHMCHFWWGEAPERRDRRSEETGDSR